MFGGAIEANLISWTFCAYTVGADKNPKRHIPQNNRKNMFDVFVHLSMMFSVLSPGYPNDIKTIHPYLQDTGGLFLWQFRLSIYIPEEYRREFPTLPVM